MPRRMKKRFYLGLIVVAVLLLALGGLLVRSGATGVRTLWPAGRRLSRKIDDHAGRVLELEDAPAAAA